MPRPRSAIAGTTDYLGVTVEQMVEHLVEWRDMLVSSSGALQAARERVSHVPTAFTDVVEIESYAVRFADIFNDYAADFDRVLVDMGQGVRARHVATLHRIYEHSRFEERQCVPFKNLHVDRPLPDESQRFLVDEIYENSRQPLVDLADLQGLVRRLETFVEEPGERPPPADLLNLKVTFLGVELDLKELARRVRSKARAQLRRRWLPPDGTKN